MPVVFSYKGCRFFFFSNEGDPIESFHIHVRRGEATAKFRLSPRVSLAGSYGMNSAELRELMRVAEESRELIAAQTQRDGYIIHGGGTGLHWDELDEDISVKFLLLGIGGRTRPARKASYSVPPVSRLTHLLLPTPYSLLLAFASRIFNSVQPRPCLVPGSHYLRLRHIAGQ